MQEAAASLQFQLEHQQKRIDGWAKGLPERIFCLGRAGVVCASLLMFALFAAVLAAEREKLHPYEVV